ncbi:PIN domain-containing protein [Gracilimonas sp. BCB1]|uniref:PIN domain-containing protein n=1 Tax=Gracilimonas sp. BCB1 TaxID=3152362 RepID=UPI0032D94A60
MVGIDTNLLARFLIKDIEEQAELVAKLIEDGKELYINQVVLSELSWVLLKIYNYPKIEFISVLDTLFETKGFYFFDQEVVKLTIEDYINSSADFNDCLIHQINRKERLITYTFDKKASNLKQMKLLD